MSVLLLALACVVALALIPIGLPGLWLIVGASLLYGPITRTAGFGWVTIGAVLALAVVAELLEWSLGGRFARRYGGGRRAAWGALIGGFAGAIVGVPVPVIGSVIGGFVGAFAGALAGELSAGSGRGVATRAATGAIVGRAAAIGAKMAIGTAMAAWLVWAAMLG